MTWTDHALGIIGSFVGIKSMTTTPTLGIIHPYEALYTTTIIDLVARHNFEPNHKNESQEYCAQVG